MASILDEDASSVHSLRLYSGLVQRTSGVWRFVCSKAYGGLGQDLAVSMPGGGVAIAIPDGITLMKRDGTFVPPPDPEAQSGTVTAFARGDGRLFALRTSPDSTRTEVGEITATTTEVL